MTKILTAGVLAAAGMGPLDSVALYLFDVSASTIFMALAGAILSFAYSEGDATPDMSKKRMYFLVVANTIISVALVAVLPEMLGWHWYSDRVEGSVVLLIAASAKVTIPFFFKTLPELLRKWLKLGEVVPPKRNNDEHN